MYRGGKTMTKEEKQLLKAKEKEYKEKAKERRAELKALTAEQRKEAKQNRLNKKAVDKKPTKKIRITGELLDVFPIRDYHNNFFLTDDNQIIDLFQIRGKSYFSATDEEIEAMVNTLASFYRLYKNDLKFIGMNYPTNTKNQQAFLTYKLEQPGLEKYQDIINEKIATLQYLENNTTDREAFIMIFAKNENHYDTLCNLLVRSGLLIEQITAEKKENIIFQLNNMNKRLKI